MFFLFHNWCSTKHPFFYLSFSMKWNFAFVISSTVERAEILSYANMETHCFYPFYLNLLKCFFSFSLLLWHLLSPLSPSPHSFTLNTFIITTILYSRVHFLYFLIVHVTICCFIITDTAPSLYKCYYYFDIIFLIAKCITNKFN